MAVYNEQTIRERVGQPRLMGTLNPGSGAGIQSFYGDNVPSVDAAAAKPQELSTDGPAITPA